MTTRRYHIMLMATLLVAMAQMMPLITLEDTAEFNGISGYGSWSTGKNH